MRVIWSRRAQADRHRIWLFNAERNIAHADRVEARLIARAASLSRFPWIGRPVPESDLRELPIPDVQYAIEYRVVDEQARIMRIWSTAQSREE